MAAGNVPESEAVAVARWRKMQLAARSSIAISRDMQAMRTMVGHAGIPMTTDDMERQIQAEQRASHRGVIMPESRFRLVWDGMQVVLLLYVALVVPFRFGFSAVAAPGSVGWWWEIFVDLYVACSRLWRARTHRPLHPTHRCAWRGLGTLWGTCS